MFLLVFVSEFLNREDQLFPPEQFSSDELNGWGVDLLISKVDLDIPITALLLVKMSQDGTDDCKSLLLGNQQFLVGDAVGQSHHGYYFGIKVEKVPKLDGGPVVDYLHGAAQL